MSYSVGSWPAESAKEMRKLLDLVTFSLTIRQRCTSPGCMMITGVSWPFTSVGGTLVGEVAGLSRLTVVSTCCSATMRSRIPCRRVRASSAPPSTRKAPDIPLVTCSATEPCLCGWYQCVPGDWFRGMRKAYWKVSPGAICSRTSSPRLSGVTWKPW